MDKNLRRNPHCVYPQDAERVINYHLVWIPRYRKQILTGDIEARLKQLLGEIATHYGFEILAHEVMPDPVHLFVSAPPKLSPAEIVRLFIHRTQSEGITSRRLKQEFLQIRRAYWGKNATLWAEGYYVGTAGHPSTTLRTGSVETIKRYIEECQKN